MLKIAMSKPDAITIGLTTKREDGCWLYQASRQPNCEWWTGTMNCYSTCLVVNGEQISMHAALLMNYPGTIKALGSIFLKI